MNRNPEPVTSKQTFQVLLTLSSLVHTRKPLNGVLCEPMTGDDMPGSEVLKHCVVAVPLSWGSRLELNCALLHLSASIR